MCFQAIHVRQGKSTGTACEAPGGLDQAPRLPEVGAEQRLRCRRRRRQPAEHACEVANVGDDRSNLDQLVFKNNVDFVPSEFCSFSNEEFG